MLNFITMSINWIVNWGNSLNCAVTITTGFIFGGAYCIAWRFYFPTVTETWLWRIASLTILGIGLISPLAYLIPEYELIGPRTQLNAVIVGNWVYMLVRAYLMVEVLISFRSMPKRVDDSVDWSQYVPVIA